jgi:uncharacterized protein
MRTLHTPILLLLVLVVLTLFNGCTDSNITETTNANFDRKSLLENVGNQIIIPAYERLANSSQTLHQAAQKLVNQPSEAQLLATQEAFKSAYRDWQSCSVYGFGPGADSTLRGSLNTFPTNTETIEANINSGQYRLGSPSNYAAKGFPAIDYLLFGQPPNYTLDKLQKDDAANQRKKYLLDLTAEIERKVIGVRDAWKSGYIQTFIENDGTDVGSSYGQLINELNYDYEIIKRNKIGVPVGLGRGLDGTLRPEQTEGFYSGISLTLCRAHLEAIRLLYLGNPSATQTGIGFDDNLRALNAQKDLLINNQVQQVSLDQAIQDQFQQGSNALAKVQDPLTNALTAQRTDVEKAYEELKKQVVLLKTDMTSALGVLITYQDSDGD